jgi:hypothetical protein
MGAVHSIIFDRIHRGKHKCRECPDVRRSKNRRSDDRNERRGEAAIGQLSSLESRYDVAKYEPLPVTLVRSKGAANATEIFEFMAMSFVG